MCDDKNPKMNSPQWSRRELFRSAALAIGATTLVPTIWIPKRIFADTLSQWGAAKHLLILNADGGLRSPSLFNAKVGLQWNPHVDPMGNNTQPGAKGTKWNVGAIFSNESIPLPLWGDEEMLPPLPAVSNSITVLGTVTHEPGAALGDGNHFSAKRRIATGFLNGEDGLLTRIYQHHPMYQGKGFDTAFPPVAIGAQARLFASAAPGNGVFRPLFFNGPQDFQNKGASAVHIDRPKWALELEAASDQRFVASLSPRDQQIAGLYVTAKAGIDRYRDILKHPMLRLGENPSLEPQLQSNARLMEVFGNGIWGGRVALAIRMFQLGSPAVVVGAGNYDTHSNETTELPPIAVDLGRQLAALRYVLPKLPHPSGGTYWDHTVISVVSEFSRDNVELTTGLNSANGSDHRGAQSRMQALPFMGGPISGGGFYGETSPQTMEPIDNDDVFHSQGVLAALLQSIGVPTVDFFPENPVPQIFGG